MPVLVFERVKISQHLRLFRRYRHKLVFAGNSNVLGILLLGLTGYWYIMGTRYTSSVHDGLMAIMASARLDDNVYKVIDWFQRKGSFIVYVTQEFGK